jgi:hypothetical protein
MVDGVALLAKCRLLTESDPTIDEQIHAFLAGAEIEWQEHLGRNSYHTGSRWVTIGPILPYTSSLDAAMKVVPGECYPWLNFGKSKGMPDARKWYAYIGAPDGWHNDDWFCEVEGPTPEIALTHAGLIARLNIGGQVA